jgi:hypothetical protein
VSRTRATVYYDSIQWGATINVSGRPQTVYVDDVKIWNADPGWPPPPTSRLGRAPAR